MAGIVDREQSCGQWSVGGGAGGTDRSGRRSTPWSPGSWLAAAAAGSRILLDRMCHCAVEHGDACPQVPRDRETVELLRRREVEGLHRLLADHGGWVRARLCREFDGALDPHQVDQAIREAVQHAWQAATEIDLERGGLVGWLLVLGRAAAVRRLARLRRRHGSSVARVEAEALAVQTMTQRLHALAPFLAQLQPLQRAVLMADFAAGGTASARDLARRLATTVNSVYVSRSNGRRKVRAALEQSQRSEDTTSAGDDPT
ncbi:MAG: hypothetical protein IPK26_08650 [Planctomycetes bacterium]|nr:hypothetical protein [Planctomycetota bacterium]